MGLLLLHHGYRVIAASHARNSAAAGPDVTAASFGQIDDTWNPGARSCRESRGPATRIITVSEQLDEDGTKAVSTVGWC
ncbi:hypothetical protein AB0K20_32490 [Micromonospora matsumotoense]|uniref:hypothetical protein n=1 Tax=Micromonospora matsumotoense TaxID=121616 RepID=UPI00343BBAAE